MKLLETVYISGVQKFAGLVWGIKYNPKKYWTARGLIYRKEFDRNFARNPGADRNASLVIGALKNLDFSSFLEVGCGYGLYLKAIENEFRLERIAGCDISPTQISQARRYLGRDSKVELTEIDGEHLPYPDRSFDVCFTYGVCIHVSHKKIEAFIREILRVTARRYLFVESSLGKDSLYYFSHDYPAVFNKLGVPLKIINDMSAIQKIYAADLE